MNFRKVRRICNVRGCRNTNCYAVSRSKETGYSVIMCADCIKDAFYTLTEKENTKTVAEQAQTGTENTEIGAEPADAGAEQAADEPVQTAAMKKKAAAKKKTAAKESE